MNTQEIQSAIAELPLGELDGQDISTLADALLTEVLTDDPDEMTDEEATEVRTGIRRGLEAAAAGQVKTLTQAIAKVRQRHGFPPSWAGRVDGTASRRTACCAASIIKRQQRWRS